MVKRQANEKLLCWEVGGGFEQRIWQERWEIDHKDQVPQGKLAAVYNIQTKPWILLMSLLFSMLEMLGTESHCKEGDCTQNSLSFLLKGKIYWTAEEKNVKIEYVNTFAYLAVIPCIMTECTLQKVWRFLITKCDPLMYCFVLHCAYLRKTWLKSCIAVNTFAIYF